MKFTIPGMLPGLNQLFGAANKNRWVGADMKRKYTRLCAHWIMTAKLTPITVPVFIHFDWYEPHSRRDVDNISTGAKFCLDALVDCGILPGDGRKWVKGISHRFPDPDKANPRIEVTIAEVG